MRTSGSPWCEDPGFNAEEFEAEFQQSVGTHSLDHDGNLPSEVGRCRLTPG